MLFASGSPFFGNFQSAFIVSHQLSFTRVSRTQKVILQSEQEVDPEQALEPKSDLLITSYRLEDNEDDIGNDEREQCAICLVDYEDVSPA
jgi:hypothetical protein